MRRKLSEIMNGYLGDEDQLRYDFLPPPRETLPGTQVDTPISPVKAEWGVSECGKKLERLFEFLNTRSRNAFVLDIMELENSSGHHVDYEVNDSNVFVILQTKDLGMVTDLDIECSRHLSSCALDVHQSRL